MGKLSTFHWERFRARYLSQFGHTDVMQSAHILRRHVSRRSSSNDLEPEAIRCTFPFFDQLSLWGCYLCARFCSLTVWAVARNGFHRVCTKCAHHLQLGCVPMSLTYSGFPAGRGHGNCLIQAASNSCKPQSVIASPAESEALSVIINVSLLL
jgi:hypothetical protein